MTDISQFTAPKSDQLNADDLIGGPRTVRITRVTGQAGEQPISVFFEGDNGKPYKPCLSMRRIMLALWGKDGNQYAGRTMTLYRDPKVTYGGIETGGIRISHMSHIDSDTTMILTESRKKRAPFKVRKFVELVESLEKQRGVIDDAVTQIESWTGDRETLSAALGRFSWTKTERSQIASALDARFAAKKTEETATEGEQT
jgi:hypothetical protein